MPLSVHLPLVAIALLCGWALTRPGLTSALRRAVNSRRDPVRFRGSAWPGYAHVSAAYLDRRALVALLPASTPEFELATFELLHALPRRRAVLRLQSASGAEDVRLCTHVALALQQLIGTTVVVVEQHATDASPLADPLVAVILAVDGRGWSGQDRDTLLTVVTREGVEVRSAVEGADGLPGRGWFLPPVPGG